MTDIGTAMAIKRKKEGHSMKSKKILLIALVAVMSLALAAGCPPPQAVEEPQVEAPARYPLTITDSAGETITIERPLERVLVLFDGPAEAMRVLAVTDKIIGGADHVIESVRRFPWIKGKASIGRVTSPCVETILYLAPDAVFGGPVWACPETLRDAELEAAGIKVIRLHLNEMGTLVDELRTMARIFDREAEAEDYIAWHDKYMNMVKDRVAAIPEEDRVRVFGVWGGGREFGLRAMGADSRPHRSMVLAGGTNIAADYIPGGSADVETEWVLGLNPDVIIHREWRAGFATDDLAGIRALYHEIKAVPGFAEMVNAVVDDRVYIFDHDVMFGLVAPVGLVYMATWFYPEEFADLDPQAIHQEFIDRFLDIDFDVRTQGVFIYPPPM